MFTSVQLFRNSNFQSSNFHFQFAWQFSDDVRTQKTVASRFRRNFKLVFRESSKFVKFRETHFEFLSEKHVPGLEEAWASALPVLIL